MKNPYINQYIFIYTKTYMSVYVDCSFIIVPLSKPDEKLRGVPQQLHYYTGECILDAYLSSPSIEYES